MLGTVLDKRVKKKKIKPLHPNIAWLINQAGNRWRWKGVSSTADL